MNEYSKHLGLSSNESQQKGMVNLWRYLTPLTRTDIDRHLTPKFMLTQPHYCSAINTIETFSFRTLTKDIQWKLCGLMARATLTG